MIIKNIVWIEDVGKEKPQYHNVGILLEKDDGKVSIKLNTIPASGWNGWLSVFEQKKRDDVPARDVNSDMEAF